MIESPGCIPLPVDNVVCPCNQISDFPQPCGIHGGVVAAQPWIQLWTATDRLSDDDVERIARRVVELLKGQW